MIKRTSWIAILAAVLLAMGLARPALAQSAESERLGSEIAQKFLGAMPLGQIATNAMGSSSVFKDLPERPEWNGYLKDAAREEFDADQPQITALIGHRLALEMTVEELRAGVKLFRGPAGDDVVRMVAGYAAGQSLTPTPTVEAAYRELISTPEGRSFADKFQHLDRLMKPVTSDMMVLIIPGMMRRFADKAEAGERARAQNHAH